MQMKQEVYVPKESTDDAQNAAKHNSNSINKPISVELLPVEVADLSEHIAKEVEKIQVLGHQS